ncbi:MAG: hypothetical protein MMC33_003324 [Icmadophila ericetorum]|nr:hypothetical protein [Icmadophila ericetorum]
MELVNSFAPQSRYSHVYFLLAHVLLTIGLVYTRSNSKIRLPLLLVIIACCFASLHGPLVRSIPGDVGSDYVFGFIFHASHFMCLAKLTPPPDAASKSRRLAWGAEKMLDARWGISSQHLPSFGKDRPQFVPSRVCLFLTRLWDFGWTSIVAYLLLNYRLHVYPDDFLVGNGFLHRLSSVSAREMAIRIHGSIFGLFLPYCTLRAAHSLASCIAIVCGDTPSRWRPLFGSIQEAYTVRRYYA